MRDQDQDLQKVHHSLHTLGQMGEEIGDELDDQNRLVPSIIQCPVHSPLATHTTKSSGGMRRGTLAY